MDAGCHFSAEATHQLPQVLRPRHARAHPQRDRGGGSVDIFDQHLVLAEALHLPRRAAQDEDVARAQLVDEHLVEPTDALVLGLQRHVVARLVGDGSAGSEGDAARASGRGEDAVNLVPVELLKRRLVKVEAVVRGQHLKDAVVVFLGEVAVAVRPPEEGEQLVRVPGLRGDGADDVLCDHVEAVLRDARSVEVALHDRAHGDSALDEVVAVQRDQPPLAGGVQQVSGAPDALQAGGHGLGGVELDDRVDEAHIDAQLQRRRGDQRVQLAALELVLHLQPVLFGHAAVVGADPRRLALGSVLFQLVQPQRRALGLVAAVGEDQRGLVCVHLLQDAVIAG